MAKTKVVINRKSFGENVMAGPGISAMLETRAAAVASRVPDADTEIVYAAVAGGGRRARARVGIAGATEDQRDSLVTALLSLFPGGKTIKRGRK